MFGMKYMGSKNRHAKYVGFQLSYGGKFFGGYRRDSIGKRNYSLEAYNNTMKQINGIIGIEFHNTDYQFLSIPFLKTYTNLHMINLPYF